MHKFSDLFKEYILGMDIPVIVPALDLNELLLSAGRAKKFLRQFKRHGPVRAAVKK
jgi:hypothetical protein